MDTGIHGYPIRRAWVWRVDHAHGFCGADIQLLIRCARAQVSLHVYPMDIRLTGGTHMSVRHAIFPRLKC
jgi:hypothetical protein